MPKRSRRRAAAAASPPPSPDDTSRETLIRLDEMELELERRCEQIKANGEALVERLRSTFMTHLIRFPKAIRTMPSDVFFGIDDGTSESSAGAAAGTAPKALASVGLPPKATTTPGAVPKVPRSARPPRAGAGAGTAASRRRPPQPRQWGVADENRGMVTPAPGKTRQLVGSGAAPPPGAATPGGHVFATPSAKLVMTGYVSRIKQLEEEVVALRAKYES